jgi:hypothetical protein
MLATYLCRLLALGLALTAFGPLGAQPITPFATTLAGTVPAPWRFVGIPGGKMAPAKLSLIVLGDEQVLRLSAQNAYGALTHPLNQQLHQLSWRWRLDQALTQSDLNQKRGDDVALKVCVSFDMPLSKIPFSERVQLAVARTFSGEPLPAATLCYVWDRLLPRDTVIANAYTQRVRFWVLNTGSQGMGQWQTHTRDVSADFMRAFGHESAVVPPTVALIVGADSDNTQGSSLAYLTSLVGVSGGEAGGVAR